MSIPAILYNYTIIISSELAHIVTIPAEILIGDSWKKEIFGIGHCVKLPGEALVSYLNLLQVIAGNVLAVRSSNCRWFRV